MTDIYEGGIYVYKEAISTSIDYNNGTITQAKLTATISSTDVYLANFYLSANGGVNWEEVQNGVAYTFSNTGTDLRWKITGSGPFQITNLIVESYH
jgi:hypothetical protein